MTIEIEKGIEIPAKHERVAGLGKTLKNMEVGDSFLYPLNKRTSVPGMALKHKPKRFVTRKVDENHIRVWRVE